jgi:hypothetical protein
VDIKKLKASLQLAQIRLKSNQSEENEAIYQEAKNAYEFALDPEKKMEEDQLPPAPIVKPATKPIVNNPLKKTATVKQAVAPEPVQPAELIQQDQNPVIPQQTDPQENQETSQTNQPENPEV